MHNDHNNWTVPVVIGSRYIFAYEKGSSEAAASITVTGGTIISRTETNSAVCGFMIIQATASQLVFNTTARGGFWDTKIALLT